MAKPAYRQSTDVFVYTNPHPKGIRSLEDCVYRAISIATGKDWITVYDELTSLGRELLSPPNGKNTLSAYLDKIGKRVKPIVNSKRLLPTDLPKRGTYVISQANHLTTVKDGRVRDTWDTSKRSSYLIWKIG